MTFSYQDMKVNSKDSIAQLSVMYIVERIIDSSRLGLSNRLMIDELL